MSRILLLGDSIRLSYRERVKALLDGEAEIHGPDDNCRFCTYTLFSLEPWLGEGQYDVIQWNNGQWDTCYMPDGRIFIPLDSYLEQEQRIATILQARTKRLIFATTTPVGGDMFAANRPRPRTNADIADYNAAVSKMLEGMGVETIDLHTPVLADLRNCIGDDMVHLTPAGVELCAGLVADNLR